MMGRPRVTFTPLILSQTFAARLHGKADELHGDMPLVVVHGHHRVVLLAFHFGENRIRGNRAVHVPSLVLGLLDRRRDLVDLFISE